MFKRSLLAVVIACGLMFSYVSLACADAPAPGYEAIGRFVPTNLPPGGEGQLVVYVYNIGAAQGSTGATLTDTLPAGVTVKAGEDPAGCTGSTVVTCSLGAVPPVSEPEYFRIPVSVSTSPSSEPDRITVSGGGALGVTNATVPVHYGLRPAPTGFANADLWISNPDGTIDTQAGSHPYELTLAFATNSTGTEGGAESPNGEPRALDVNLPPGLVGEPGAVPKCTREEFDGEVCPPDSEIGENHVSPSGVGLVTEYVYNLVPPPGVAAEFGFTLMGSVSFWMRVCAVEGITASLSMRMCRSAGSCSTRRRSGVCRVNTVLVPKISRC